MRQGCYNNTVYILLLHNTGIIKILAKFGLYDLLGFWHDILLPQLVCGHMKGQNYMYHKQTKKK